MIHERIRAQVDRALENDLSPREYASLFTHLKNCQNCQAYYSQYRLLEDALYAGQTPTPKRALARMESSILAQLPEESPSAMRPRWYLWGLAALPALAVILFVLVGLPQISPTDEGEFASRGGRIDAHAELGLRVFRITKDGAENATKIRSGDTLAFAHANRGTQPLVFALVIVPQKGEARVLKTAQQGIGIVDARPGTIDEAIDTTFLVPADFGSTLRVIALFSPRRKILESFLKRIDRPADAWMLDVQKNGSLEAIEEILYVEPEEIK